MADADDKEKAEKLAAAKKRFEQLKKQKAGGATKKAGAGKKKEKEDKTAAAPSAATAAAEDEGDTEVKPSADEERDAATTADDGGIDEAEATKDTHVPGDQDSESLQSKRRSAAFRGALPVSGSDENASLANLQIRSKIDELESTNKGLRADWQAAEEKLKKAEEALENAAELRSRADQADAQGEELEKLKSEIASLKRQNTQLATQASKRRQSQSISSPVASSDEFASQLASKSATIESLELEISNLNNKLTAASTTSTEQLGQISTLENSLARAERESNAASQELSDLKQNLERASERATKEGTSKASAETRIAQLETELSAAQRASAEASKRAETLEKKVEALTSLHREADTRHQSKQRDFEKTERELRSRVTNLSNENATLKEARDRHRKAEAHGADDGLDELEDEERQRLAAKVRSLEEEVFELRRGVWRDKRREMQPGIDEHSSPGGFDEVDLSHPSMRRHNSGHSSLQDVINSGISAFTGASSRRKSSGAATRPARAQSLGLLNEDGDAEDEFDFEIDEEAFRVAQEEEMKARLERVKEVKRGLPAWKGWRVDLVDVRAGLGGVFDV